MKGNKCKKLTINNNDNKIQHEKYISDDKVCNNTQYRQTLTRIWNNESTAGDKYHRALKQHCPPLARHKYDTD